MTQPQSFVDETPWDPRLFIPNVEFYITNVCNLTCSNCNRFNNHDFRGWQDWKIYESIYQQWAQHIRLQRITLMGGEPLLNPTVLNWVNGINHLWKKPVQILTNGTRINHVAGLYEVLERFQDPLHVGARNWLGVSLHNPLDRNRCFQEIKKFLQEPIKYYHRDDADNINMSWTYGADHAFVDRNGVRVHVWEYTSFYTAAVQKTAAGRFGVFDNDPEMAHRGCGFVRYKCYHFVRGALYKCGPVALFPEFDQQHRFDITDSQREIMYGYRPLTVDRVQQHGQDFMAHIDNVIPQCGFCPVEFTNHELTAANKKPGSRSAYD